MASVDGLDGQELRRWALGKGEARRVQEVGGELAVAVALAGPAGAPAAGALLLDPDPDPDPDQDEARTLLSAEAPVDITEHCWPLVPQPTDAAIYLQEIVDGNGALDAYWHREQDGVALPLAGGLSDPTTRLVGDWPDTHLEWTFRHTHYPGLRLRRRVPLFDELGRPDPPEYATIHLMEDLDTGQLPPADRAVNGVLDI